MSEFLAKPASQITAEEFSLILLWPLALDPRCYDEGWFEAFDPGAPWREVENRLTHLDSGNAITQDAYQEYVYFHNFVQDFLYGDTNPAMRIWRRDDLKMTTVNLEEFSAMLDIKRLRLHVFEAGAAILAVELEGQRLTLDRLLKLQNRLRRAYPPFWKKETAGEYPVSIMWEGGGDMVFKAMTPDEACSDIDGKLGVVNAPVAAWWRALVPGLRIEGEGPERAPHWRHVVDDRMPSMLRLSVENPREISEGDWFRIAYADEPGDNPTPYAERFLEGEPSPFYDRFWEPDRRGPQDQTTRYAISGYHFAMVGRSKWFFDKVLKDHFRRHYFQMGLIVHFQFAALLALSKAISEAVKAKDEQRLPERIKALRKRHLRFAHRFWFTGVSNQMQARDLFDRWREAMGTKALYEDVNGELAQANEFLEAQEQGRIAEAGMRLNIIASVGLILSLAAGLLGANVLIDDKAREHAHFATALLVLAVTLLGGGGLLALLGDRKPELALKRLPYWLFGLGILAGLLFLSSEEVYEILSVLFGRP